MKILLVCKHNIARSYCAEMILKSLFPSFEILSAGVNTSGHQYFYPWRNSILSELGVEFVNRFPVPVELVLSEFRSQDLIITSDAEVHDIVKSKLGSRTEPHIFSLDSFGLEKWSVPNEPSGMSLSKIRLEVIKSIVSFNRIIEITQKIEETHDNIVVFFELHPEPQLCIDYAIEELQNQRNVIFLHPISYSERFPVEYFETLEKICFSDSPMIYMPRFEDPFLLRKLISLEILSKLKSLSITHFPITFFSAGGSVHDASESGLLSGMLSSRWRVLANGTEFISQTSL